MSSIPAPVAPMANFVLANRVELFDVAPMSMGRILDCPLRTLVVYIRILVCELAGAVARGWYQRPTNEKTNDFCAIIAYSSCFRLCTVQGMFTQPT